LLRCHDSELLILVVDYSNFFRSDAMVNPYVFIDGLASEIIRPGTNANHNKTAKVFQSQRRDYDGNFTVAAVYDRRRSRNCDIPAVIDRRYSEILLLSSVGSKRAHKTV